MKVPDNPDTAEQEANVPVVCERVANRAAGLLADVGGFARVYILTVWPERGQEDYADRDLDIPR